MLAVTCCQLVKHGARLCVDLPNAKQMILRVLVIDAKDKKILPGLSVLPRCQSSNSPLTLSFFRINISMKQKKEINKRLTRPWSKVNESPRNPAERCYS